MNKVLKMSSSLASCFPRPSEAKKASKEIEKQLKEAKRVAKSQVKLLVLGAAESGKSTFIKQMRIIHGKGYSHDEKTDYIPLIYQNINTSVKMLIRAMENLGIEYESENNKNIAKMLLQVDKDEEASLSPETVESISRLWEDRGIQQCYMRRNEFHLIDSASYYLNELARITEASYIPTVQDILRTRSPTCGIFEYIFDIDRFIFGIVDVGGQKSERRKWIHCFESVTSIIFLAALSEYDQTIPLEEISQDLRSNLQNPNVMDSPSYNNNSPRRKNLHKTDSLQRPGKDYHRRPSKNMVQRNGSPTVHHHHHKKMKPLSPLPPLPSRNLEDNNLGSPKTNRRHFRYVEPEPDLPVINRLDESCALFTTIFQNPFFKDTSVILFLNKTDILEEKIQYSPLSKHFPSFQGPKKDVKAAKAYILNLYIQCFQSLKSTKRSMYSHYTCATDTDNIRFVFAAVKDTVLQSYLHNYNLV